jgi:hypothetical protein
MRNAAQEHLALVCAASRSRLETWDFRLAMMVEVRLEQVDLRGIGVGRCSQWRYHRNVASRSSKVSESYTLAELTTLPESIV